MSGYGQDNAHLFHIFAGNVFAPHLDKLTYTKKQFLNGVKEALTTDKLLGSIFSKASPFLADAFPLSRKMKTFGLIFLRTFWLE